MIYTLQTSWVRPPLSMNDRGNHWAKHRAKTAVRDEIITLARQAKIPRMDKIQVRMIWTVPTKHVRDTDNPVATLKVVCDALIDPKSKRPGAGIVPDDSPQWMTKEMPVIEYVKGQSGVRVEIEEVDA